MEKRSEGISQWFWSCYHRSHSDEYKKMIMQNFLANARISSGLSYGKLHRSVIDSRNQYRKTTLRD